MAVRYECGACGRDVTVAAAKAGPWCPWCHQRDIRVAEPREAPARGTAIVTALDDVDEPETLPCSAPLVAGLGGVQLGALIVVSGEPGQGKSTECARVAVALDEPPAYLDREMTPQRCLVVLKHAGASRKFIRGTRRIEADHWQDALELARTRRVWIVDSVSEWAAQEEEKAFAAALVDAAKEDRVILAINQWTRQGRARGTLTVEHRGDCTIDVLAGAFDVRKTRWGEKGVYPRPRIAPPGAKTARTAT